MTNHRSAKRRLTAGVDSRFDDIRGGTEEMIRLAQHGHTFGAHTPSNSDDGRDTIHAAKFYNRSIYSL